MSISGEEGSMEETEEVIDDCGDEVKTTGSNKKEKGTPKYKQKFLVKWLSMFHPWLTRCDDNLEKPFCRACQCRLDCNKCHLERHEKTSKHARNLELLLKNGEGAVKESFTVRQERSKYYRQRKDAGGVNYVHVVSPGEMDASEVYLDESGVEGETVQYSHQYSVSSSGGDHNYLDIETFKEEYIPAERKASHQKTVYVKPEKVIESGAVRKPTNQLSAGYKKKDRMKLFMQIKKDKNELLQSFKELMGNTSATSTTSSTYTPPQEKNTVDLFFESVSSTVKTLSPKLIAEAKMRVSQLICELELRALKENETLSEAGAKTLVREDE